MNTMFRKCCSIVVGLVYVASGHGGTEFPFIVDWGRWAEETVGFML